MQKILTYIWRVCLVLTFLGGLGLISLWLLRAYEHHVFGDVIPDDAFEPLITLFAYVTGFSGIGAIAAWFAPKRSATVQSQVHQSIGNQRHVTTAGGDYAEGNIDKRQGMFVSGGAFQQEIIGHQYNYY